jgi:hypothetical protein|tara:strand:- start:1264 stop:1485 length:222 start_codon:yes stop_codon:yes gene_type:complete
MEKLFRLLGGRKMFFAIILLAISTIFLFIDKSDFGGWSNFVIWIFGTYCVGNGIEHISEMKNKDCCGEECCKK